MSRLAKKIILGMFSTVINFGFKLKFLQEWFSNRPRRPVSAEESMLQKTKEINFFGKNVCSTQAQFS